MLRCRFVRQSTRLSSETVVKLEPFQQEIGNKNERYFNS